MSAQSSQGARARQAGRLSEAFQRSQEYKEQAKSEERSDDQRKLKITNFALEDYTFNHKSPSRMIKKSMRTRSAYICADLSLHIAQSK
ncbi:MAG: hypothetical protein D6772_06130 [Bacteroidetes bacterium]|nr:MAG: hypothetical protein D6772_06130 [Bacteroidota bacterium]